MSNETIYSPGLCIDNFTSNSSELAFPSSFRIYLISLPTKSLILNFSVKCLAIEKYRFGETQTNE